MIEKNAPPRNYEFRLAVPSTTAVDIYVVKNIGTAVLTYGNFFSSTHGIELIVTNNSDDPTIIGDSSNYEWELNTPWGDFSDTGSGNLTGDFTIQIDDATLTGNCSLWQLDFTELRLVHATDTLATISSQSDSGADYDARENKDDWRSQCLFFPAIPTGPSIPACPVSTASFIDWEYKRECVIGCGFRYNEDGVTWIYPDIEIINPNPITGICLDGCDPEWDEVTQDDSLGQGCWDIEVTSRYEYIQNHDLFRTDECHCTDPPDRFFNRYIWRIRRFLNEKRNSAWVHRKDGPIRDYRAVRTTTCDPLVVDSDDVTITTTDPKCLTQPYTYQGLSVAYCVFFDVVACNPPGPFDPPSVCEGEVPDDYYCSVTATGVMSWPTAVKCGQQGPVFIVQDVQGRLFEARIDNSDVWFRRSNDSRSADGWQIDTRISNSGDVIRSAFDYDAVYRRFELYYETDDHDIYYSFSMGDEGKTWSTPTLIGSDMYNFYTATNHSNDDRFRCWFEFDTGTSGPGTAKGQYRRATESSWSAVFTFQSMGSPISVSEGGMCNVASSFSNQGEWTWDPVLDGDTSPTTHFSNDEGRTWRVQP